MNDIASELIKKNIIREKGLDSFKIANTTEKDLSDSPFMHIWWYT